MFTSCQERPEEKGGTHDFAESTVAQMDQSVPENSLAVLPFTSGDTDVEQRYFTDGIHDDLVRHLSLMKEMKVISRASVLHFKNSNKPIAEVAKLLGVTNILMGDIQIIEDNIQLNVQLVQVATDKTIWSGSFDNLTTTQNIFNIQSSISMEVSKALNTNLYEIENITSSEISTDNIEAYAAYLKGLQLMEIRNARSLKEAKRLFEKAVSLDNEFAQAYVELGSVYSLMASYAGLDDDTAHELAWDNMEQGMRLNNNLAAAHALKGILISNKDGDLDAASIAFEKAIAINPNYAPSYHFYANAVRDQGHDFRKAAKIFSKAVQLNPLSPVILLNQSMYLAQSGYRTEAIEVLKKGITLQPGYPFFWNNLRRNFTYAGQLDSAAYYTHRGVILNKADGLYLRYYLETLEPLGLYSEIESILNDFTPQNRQDTMVALYARFDLALVTQEFSTSFELLGQFETINPDKNFALWHDHFFFKSEFDQLVLHYEEAYPNLANGDQLSAHNLGALRRFQEYLYSLKQIGRIQKAEELWKRFGFLLIKKPEGKNEFIKNRELRVLSNLRQQLIEDNREEALRLLPGLSQKVYFVYLSELDYDPIYSTIRMHPEFQKILSYMHTALEIQRANFRNYLSMSDEAVLFE